MLLYVTLLIFTAHECINVYYFQREIRELSCFWQKKAKYSNDSYNNFAYAVIYIHNFEYKLPKKII